MSEQFFERIILGFIIKVLPYWIITYIFVNFITSQIWSDCPLWLVLIICVIIFWSTLKYFELEVDPNSSKVTKNTIGGKLTPYWPGFNFISIFEKLMYTVDTQKHNSTKETGDWDTTDDKMKGAWKVLWRVNIRDHKNRNKNMIAYVQTTISNIDSNISLTVNQKITNFCLPKTSQEAKENRKDALKKKDLQSEGLCEEYGIEIIDSGLEDLDYSDATEEARKAKKAMDEFQKSVNALMKSPTNPHGCETVAEAQKIVKAKMLNNYQEIEINNPTGVPVVINPKK